ncbi:uncharacterized protein LOC133338744 [Musca vetustissima]|uniref:uncharacterized protein LOC133338744 n=1 Tax=Musca vetustissima TaxID=27455 RepID=UPI002AB7E1A4|nr:uncharacterized protein LOC133338744 [Musca vetustissima]
MSHARKPQLETAEKVEENFVKYQNYGENARQEYEKLYTEMWNGLKDEHLEPIAKILMERDKIVLKHREQIVQSVRNNLQKQMINTLNNFWQNAGVSEALISLEMCKEKFKSYEGCKWNMDSKTPSERTLPIRMQFKEKRLRYLQAQLKYQETQLQQVMQENKSLRQQLHEVKQQRVYLLELIGEYRKKFAVTQPEILRLQMELLGEPLPLDDGDGNEENIEPNRMNE